MLHIAAGDDEYTVSETVVDAAQDIDVNEAGPTATITAVMSDPHEPVWRLVETAPSTGQPHLHATPTLDFTTVHRGTVELVLEDASVALRQGEVIVLRGQRQAWRALGEQPCVLSSVNAPLGARPMS